MSRTRDWRRAGAWCLACCVLWLAVLNAYHAGTVVGYQKGYDQASVAEYEAWLKVPKTCPPCQAAPEVTVTETCRIEPTDCRTECERLFYESPNVKPVVIR